MSACSSLALNCAIGQRAGDAGDEHEDLGRIAEPVVLQCEPAESVVRDMIEVGEPKGEAAARVEATVAVGQVVGGGSCRR